MSAHKVKFKFRQKKIQQNVIKIFITMKFE